MRTDLVFLEGKRLILRPLLESDFTVERLNWLNDPVVNAFSQRRPFPVSWDQMRSYDDYYVKNSGKGFVLAVVDKEQSRHIGSISMVDIHPVNRCADIALLIGNSEYWNRGYGSEAIYLLSKHGFQNMNLHKLIAGTFNPAFVKCVQKLGWEIEGVFKERIWLSGRYHDQTWLSILKSQFTILEQYEADSVSSKGV